MGLWRAINMAPLRGFISSSAKAAIPGKMSDAHPEGRAHSGAVESAGEDGAPLMLTDLSRMRPQGAGRHPDALGDELASLLPRAQRIS